MMYLDTWKKSFDYSSRSTRTEFWVFSIVNTVIYISLIALLTYLELKHDSSLTKTDVKQNFENSPTVIAFAIASMISTIPLYVRRLHDVNKSGWELFITFIPIIGPLYIGYVTGLKGGDKSENRFGPNPRSIS